MPKDPELLAHQQWLGYLQPVGLVVSPPALLQAGAHVNVNVLAEHQKFLGHVTEALEVGRPEPLPAITDLRGLLLDVLGWQPGDLVEATDPRATGLEVVLPEYHDRLQPTYAVPEDARAESPAWLMLIQSLPVGTPLDEVVEKDERRWQATPQARFERLLRETQVPIGLLANGTHLRLVYYPRGESAGHLTFPVQPMTEVAGRPIFAALLMLLSAERLFSLPDRQRLPSLLAESRKYQNTVSTELAKQVLAALYELLRGFQAADDLSKRELLREVLARDPDGVYGGLLTVLLRLVFLLYAEDRGLMSDAEVYVRHYSVTGLFDRLRADAGRYPDTMDQRYGAWAQLLALFRLVHDGGGHGRMRLPARHGYLFQPDRYPFLEGRRAGSLRQPAEQVKPPLVADGVVFRALQNLLILDGERISYSTLDVEQIGSVYETIMGFRLEMAAGRSVAVKPTKPHGAPVTINLEALLQVPSRDRGKWLKEQTDQGVTGAALNALKAADSPEALTAALDRKVARELTPNIVPAGTMVLQPSDERRRSGSHYTPRSLTEPIVGKALEPVLKGLGEAPTPEQLLGLKVCDPAMGSGAFLVEACRQLGDELVKAWRRHDCLPTIPPDEDEVLHARRLVAQRCLYGVDKNPMAADLAKLSLWLATLAKDHPFTFIDHALRCGDSLVGLTRDQIVRFHWKEGPQQQRLDAQDVLDHLRAATRMRHQILDAGDEVSFLLKQQKLALADESLSLVRLAGDLVIAAFFGADKDKTRQDRRDELLGQLTDYLRTRNMNLSPTPVAKALRDGPKGITPFHWEIEFPEVFDRENAGFDMIVGNPPFLGGTLIGGRLGLAYHDYMVEAYPPATGLADLIAFFLRRSFTLLRHKGAFGLIATNTVAQGDTRSTGLEEIARQGGSVYQAQRRYKWPGAAAVIVSVIHVARTDSPVGPLLDGIPVERISAFLLKGNADAMPKALRQNKGCSFLGTKIWGAGFVFEGEPSDGSSPLTEMERLIAQDPRNSEVIFAYLGGEEFNTSPTQSPCRFVIDFGDMSETEARRWPTLFSIVEERVRPVRAGNKQRNYREHWWQHANRVEEAGPYLRQHGRLLALTSVSKHLSVAFVRSGTIIANSIVLLLLHEDADFAVLQSRIHEVWARFIGSSLEDRLRYTTPCFDTFPQPSPTDLTVMSTLGAQYYEFRAQLMKRNGEGFTMTYNRFHDPNERSADILRLRELHAAMDRAVLDAYDWTDLRPTCEFLLDYEDDEDDEEAGGRQRKKPWRYRWPDDFREEVLARLLELSRQRAEQEALAGAAVAKSKAKKGRKSPPERAAIRRGRTLFPDEETKAIQLQFGEAVLCVTLLLSTWSRRGVQRVRRDVLDAALVLMVNPDLRQRLLGRPPAATGSTHSAGRVFIPALEFVLDRLHQNDVIRVGDIEGLPVVQLGPQVVPLEQLAAADRLRADETIQVIAQQGEQPVRAFLAENLHESYELVS
jgi:hypothetical protein